MRRRAGRHRSAAGMFVSERCSDGDMVVDRAVERDAVNDRGRRGVEMLVRRGGQVAATNWKDSIHQRILGTDHQYNQ